MTDQSNTASKGVSKGVIGAIIVPLIAHYHAMLVLALIHHYPLVDSFAGELLVSGAESFIGGSAVYWTPDSIVAEIVTIILWAKSAWKKIRNAINSSN